MKTRGHRFFCVCALVSATLFARADQCSDILEHGIFDQYKVTSQKDFQAKVKEFFSKSWEDLKKEHSSSQGGGGLDFFDYFKLTGDGKNDEERFNQLRSQYQSNKDNLFSTSDRFEFESKFVNQSVVDAWKECESGKTVSGWYTAQPDSATVTVHYTLKGPDDPDQVTVSQVIFDDRHLTPLKSSGLQDGSILKKFDYLSQSYRRLDKGAADVTINVVGHGHIALTIQPVPTPTPTITPPPTITPTPTPTPAEVVRTIAANVPHWQGDVTIPYKSHAIVTILANGKLWTFDNGANKVDAYGWLPIGPDLRPWPMRNSGILGALLCRLDSQPPKTFSKTVKELQFEGPGTLRFMMNDTYWHIGSIRYGDVWTKDFPDGPPGMADDLGNGFDDNSGEQDVLVKIYSDQ